MNWDIAIKAVTGFLVGAILVFGYMRQRTRKPKPPEFELDRMRRHLGIVKTPAPKMWSDAWVAGAETTVRHKTETAQQIGSRIVDDMDQKRGSETALEAQRRSRYGNQI